MSAQNIGRFSFFKILGITFVILWVLMIVSFFISADLKTLINRNIIHPYLKEPIYFSLQIILDIIVAYFISGHLGHLIINKGKNPVRTTFVGIVTIWFGVLCVAMFSEIIKRNITYGHTLELLGWGILIWLFMGGPLFLIIGSIHGLLTSKFIAKDIEKMKNAL